MIKIYDKMVYIEHFPDGTMKIELPTIVINYSQIEITWRYENDAELAVLIYVVRHLKNITRKTTLFILNMPYLPNARMDRIHNDREVFTLKGFADAINWLDFDTVYIYDVHSNVGSALINNVVVKSPKGIIEHVINEIDFKYKDLILYFPDDGAAKRYSDMFPDYPYCYGEKRRDWKTGKILGLNIVSKEVNLENATVLMIDDIISYGGSLYYSAKELKDEGVKTIFAYATHTENSVLDQDKGTFIKLLDNGTVSELYTTNSIFTGYYKRIKTYEIC